MHTRWLIVVTTACLLTSLGKSPDDPRFKSPQQLLSTYWTAVGMNDATTVLQCFATDAAEPRLGEVFFLPSVSVLAIDSLIYQAEETYDQVWPHDSYWANYIVRFRPIGSASVFKFYAKTELCQTRHGWRIYAHQFIPDIPFPPEIYPVTRSPFPPSPHRGGGIFSDIH